MGSHSQEAGLKVAIEFLKFHNFLIELEREIFLNKRFEIRSFQNLKQWSLGSAEQKRVEKEGPLDERKSTFERGSLLNSAGEIKETPKPMR